MFHSNIIANEVKMELRILKYFLAVAQEENFTRAAEKLHLSQPTLSRQLKDMEKEYGRALFVRQPRRILLTEEGLLLKKRAEEILSLVAKTENELLHSTDSLSGEIRIGSGESINFQMVMDIAQKMRQHYPKVNFHIISGDSLTTMSLLDKGLVDFVFGYGKSDPEKYAWCTLPARDRWGVIMPRDSSLAVKEAIEPADLHDKPLILSRQAMSTSTHGDPVKQWLAKPLAQLNIIGSYNLLFNGLMMVRAHMGYAIAFENLLNPYDTELCFRPLIPTVYDTPLIIWQKQQIFSKSSQYFLKLLKESFTD